VVSVPVRAFLCYVAAETLLLCNAPHDIVHMFSGAVRLWAVATCWFPTVLALILAPSTGMLTSAVWADIHGSFNSVPQDGRLDHIFDLSSSQIVPFNYNDNWWGGDIAPLFPFLNALRCTIGITGILPESYTITDNANMDSWSTIIYYHSDFLIGSTFRISSPIIHMYIHQPSYQ
jgi:hypothetical protein